jgi:hypothetical protein
MFKKWKHRVVVAVVVVAVALVISVAVVFSRIIISVGAVAVVVVYSLIFNVIVAVVFDAVVKNNFQYFELSNPIWSLIFKIEMFIDDQKQTDN